MSLLTIKQKRHRTKRYRSASPRVHRVTPKENSIVTFDYCQARSKSREIELSRFKLSVMSRQFQKVGLFTSISLLILGGAYQNPANAISADEYKSSVSKKVIELNFDVSKVSKYIIKMVNTSDQSLSCKIQAYGIIGTLDGLAQSKLAMESNTIDMSKMNAEIKKSIEKSLEKTNRMVTESNYQALDKSLRITDSVCK